MRQSPDDLPLIEDLLCFALHAAARASEASYRPVLSKLGLTYPQYLALLVIWRRNGVSLGEIGTQLHLESGTLTPLVKRLEARGWVVRSRDSMDERVVRIHVTEQGLALRAEVSAAIRDMMCRLDLPDEFAGLRAQIDQLRLVITQTMEQLDDGALASAS